MSHISRIVLILLTAATLMSGHALHAQGTFGTLAGTVTHAGTPLPGVSVTLTSPSLQGSRVASSNHLGDYHVPALPPGQYHATYELGGMQTVTRTARVTLASTHRLDVALQPSVVAEAVTVTASDNVAVAPDGIQTNLQYDLVEMLPLGRDVTGAISLAPGVTTNSQGQTVVGGGYAYDSLYLVNGGITNEMITGQTESLFIEDAIQEITVLNGTISAELGRFTGGVVSVITKSGGNEASGSLRASLTNPAWTERSAAGEAKAESILGDTWEATLGGRIVRDRLWFFGAGRFVEVNPQSAFMDSLESYAVEETDDRVEIKLTGQLTPRHSLVGSYVSWKTSTTPYCPFGCWEVSALDIDGMRVPRELLVARYNGIVKSNVLLESGYSSKDLEFVDGGGEHVTTDYSDPRDIAQGTWGYDVSLYGTIWGAPAFCAPCGAGDDRENESWNLKATWYLATASLGTHNVVAGYETFAARRAPVGVPSGSMFGVYIYSGIAPTRTGPAGEPGTLRPVVSYGDMIVYSPSAGAPLATDFVTDSLFLNDKWDLGSRWSFNLGVRFDRNDGTAGRGVTISKDQNLSPRLGMTYDVGGDGRLRLHASFSRYVSHIQQLVGGAGDSGSRTDYYYWYDGPTIGGPDSGLSSFDVLEQTFAWLLAQGWTPDNIGGVPSFAGTSIFGFNRRLDGTLTSQSADEIALGVSVQLGQRGFVRLDYIDKWWDNFYVSSTTPGDQVESLWGPVDVFTIDNCSDCLERTYEAVQVQAGYRVSDRISAGGNYTWSEARGNTIGEFSFATWDEVLSYPEYHDFPQNRPVGFLPTDRTHKARAWVSYDLPLGKWGRISTSLLQRFDSGAPYSAARFINTLPYVECDPCGYANPPLSQQYFFSDRGEYRWESATSTDLALNYEFPIAQTSVFVQGELLNAFDEQAVVSGVTSVRQLKPFNPFTETPIEGVHWEKVSNFGQPRNARSSYQQPRTYRFSVGMRF